MKDYLIEQKISATVVKIEWERVFLHLYVRVVQNDMSYPLDRNALAFYAVDKLLYEAQAGFRVMEIQGDVYHLRLNVTNNGEHKCVPAGEYLIEVCQGDELLADCETDTSIVEGIENHSRNFLYGARKKVYTVSFFVEEDAPTLPFEMVILAATQTMMQFPQRTHLHTKIHPVKDMQATWLSSKNFLRSYYDFCRKRYQKDRPHTVLFLTEQNKTIASNLKAVKERMEQRGLDKEYTILTSARFAGLGGNGFKSWFDVVGKAARSQTIFVDDHAPFLDWLKLSDDTKVIQLWHAGAGFKSSGYSRWGHVGCPGPVSAHRQYSYGIAGSKSIAHFFSEVWGINDEYVLPTGMPRMDEYLDEDVRRRKTEELYQKYPFCKGKKVILFAPTYRGRNKPEAHYPYELIDFDGLARVCGDEYVVLFKMHPWVRKPITIPKQYQDRFVDVVKYPNINDLFYITDLLITDYSSNIFEYSLMGKPMLFFAYDKIQYAFSRGFHRPYEESAPGKVCYTFAQLLSAIESQDFESEKVAQYVEHHFDHIDTHASDRVIDWLLLGNIPQEFQDEIRKVKETNAYMRSLDFTLGGKRKPLILLEQGNT